MDNRQFVICEEVLFHGRPYYIAHIRHNKAVIADIITDERKTVPLSELEHAVKPEDSGKIRLLSSILLSFPSDRKTKKNAVAIGKSGKGRTFVEPSDFLGGTGLSFESAQEYIGCTYREFALSTAMSYLRDFPPEETLFMQAYAQISIRIATDFQEAGEGLKTVLLLKEPKRILKDGMKDILCTVPDADEMTVGNVLNVLRRKEEK